MKSLISIIRLFIFLAFFGLVSCGAAKTENNDNEKKIETADGNTTNTAKNTETASTNESNPKKSSQDITNESSDSQSTNTKGFNFVGTYNFTENVGKTAGGTGIMYSYTILVTKENGAYQAQFNIDGYQTLTRLVCSVTETKINAAAPASSLILKFEKIGKDHMGMGSAYKPGQALLDIGPKGGIMAQPGEKDLDVIFTTSFTSDKQKDKTFVFKRVK